MSTILDIGEGENMRKFILLVVALVALAIPATAVAVTLHEPHEGLGCEGGGTFHFVANQLGGATTGTLDATFSSGDVIIDMSPTHTTRGTLHWTLEASGTVTSAESSVGGKLVLSDFECDDEKK
jgi:hypothetical protein